MTLYFIEEIGQMCLHGLDASLLNVMLCWHLSTTRKYLMARWGASLTLVGVNPHFK